MAHLLLLPLLGGKRPLTLEAVGCRVRIRYRDPAVGTLVRGAYGALQSDGQAADVTYVASAHKPTGYCLHATDREPVVAADEAELLMLFETELSIELQTRRPDLFFLHAAALEYDGRAVLLVGESGAGKSTAAWGLVHEGFGYLSDELAPIDPETLEVAPYPRALCLKGDPPASYPRPARVLRTARTLHISPDELPGGVIDTPLPVEAIFFVQHRAGSPGIEPITKGEAAARLMAHVLNALAHPDAGLEAASRIASEVAAFRLWSGALPATAELVKSALAVPAYR